MLLRFALDVAPLWNSPDEVREWTISLPKIALADVVWLFQFAKALDLLPPSVRPSVVKFHFAADRKLALGSQLLQRFFISKVYSDGKPSDKMPTLASISIIRDAESGRPSYHAPSSCEGQECVLQDYNVSHHNPKSASVSAPCLVILVARITAATSAPPSLRIGVDLVPTTHSRGSSSQASFLETFRDADVFTAREIKNIYSPLMEGDKVKMLFLHWAMKEAYCKAIGTGLVTDLLAIDFREIKLDVVERGARDTQVKVFVDGVVEDGWMLEIEKLLDEHYVAIAVDSWSVEEEEEEKGEWVWINIEEDILKNWSGESEAS